MSITVSKKMANQLLSKSGYQVASGRRSRKIKRKIRRAAPSILKTAGIVGSFFVAPPGRTPPANSFYQAATNPSWGWNNAFADLLVNYTGYDFRFGTWHMPSGLLVLALGGIASKIAGKFAGPRPFKGIPLAGKYKL